MRRDFLPYEVEAVVCSVVVVVLVVYVPDEVGDSVCRFGQSFQFVLVLALEFLGEDLGGEGTDSGEVWNFRDAVFFQRGLSCFAQRQIVYLFLCGGKASGYEDDRED